MSRAFTKEADDRDPSPQIVLAREHPYRVTPAGFTELQRQLQQAQERNDQRAISDLQERIGAAEVIDPSEHKRQTVDFGARVTIEVSGQGRATYSIVGEDEANPLAGSISWLSPLAQALWNHRPGDRVLWQRPAGNVNVKLISIEY